MKQECPKMYFISTSDIFNSFTWILTTWAAPVGYTPASVGSLATCDAFGFVNTMSSLSTSLYNCSLATFYFYQLKKNMPPSQMKKAEKWMHVIPWIWGLLVAIIAAAVRAYGPYGIVCM